MALTKPRILYFHHAIGMGGAPRSLAFLIAGLDRDRFEPLVIMPKRPGNGQVRQLFAEAGAEVIEETDIRPFNGSTVAPCRGLKKRGYAVLSYNRTVRAARNWVDRLRPSLVHLNSTCLVAAAKGTHQVDPDLPVIAHVREPLLTNAWGRWLARMNRQHVNWFIAIDQFGLDSIGLASPRGNVVYNFVDRQQFHPQPAFVAMRREALGWLPDQVIFLSLSRVAPANGAWELARLVAKTDTQLPLSARFVFAGFAEPPSDYERKTRSLISTVSRCDSLDFVSDVVPVLDAADVIVAPFTSPHMPVVSLRGRPWACRHWSRGSPI